MKWNIFKKEKKEEHRQFSDAITWHPLSTALNTPVTDFKALEIVAYFSCIKAISEDIACLPIKLLNSENIPQLKHNLFLLLHNEPNSYQTTQSLIETLISHALMFHGGFIEIVRDKSGKPFSLHNIDPRCVTVKKLGNSVEYWIKYLNKEPFNIPNENIIHIHGLGFDGITSYLLHEMARNTLKLNLGATLFSNAYFENGTNNSSVISYENKIEEEHYAELKRRYGEEHSGGKNFHKTIILDNGAKYENVTHDASKTALVDTLNFTLREIACLFRVPLHKLQYLLDSKYSTTDAAQTDYLQNCLLPWIRKIENEFNRKLLMPVEKLELTISFNVRAMLRGALTEQANYFKTMVEYGLLTHNEIRAFDSMPSYGEIGDVPTMQLNRASIEKILEGEHLKGLIDNQMVNTDNKSENSRNLINSLMTRLFAAANEKIERLSKKSNSQELIENFISESGQTFRNNLEPHLRVIADSLELSNDEMNEVENNLTNHFLSCLQNRELINIERIK